MDSRELLTDAFGRIHEIVHAVLGEASGAAPGAELLTYRADPSSNTIAWLIWHLTRVQDDHLADAFGGQQVWTQDGWAGRFALPFENSATGYGHTDTEVAAVQADARLLGGYHDAVYERTVQLLAAVTEQELDRVVDTAWNPPVTLGVRLVSVIADGLQHAGQAAFVRGIATRAGA